MYATLDGFTAYANGLTLARAATARDVEGCETRVSAYIAPRVPVTDDETTAFTKATYEQLAHELSTNLSGVSDMAVSGINNFTVGKFSAQIAPAARGMFPVGISPDARAYLYTAGLLYRGADV